MPTAIAPLGPVATGRCGWGRATGSASSRRRHCCSCRYRCAHGGEEDAAVGGVARQRRAPARSPGRASRSPGEGAAAVDAAIEPRGRRIVWLGGGGEQRAAAGGDADDARVGERSPPSSFHDAPPCCCRARDALAAAILDTAGAATRPFDVMPTRRSTCRGWDRSDRRPAAIDSERCLSDSGVQLAPPLRVTQMPQLVPRTYIVGIGRMRQHAWIAALWCRWAARRCSGW